MSLLGSREKQLLLELARRSLSLAAESGEFLKDLPHDPLLGESTGAFVTLHYRGCLRGCIGQIGLGQSLIEVVAHCARSAALEDPRFEPVQPSEVTEIEIELSVLSRLEEIAPDRIEAGKHGLMVSRGWQRGVLLPQVATEYRWAAARFLGETCVKAGLERNAWQDSGTKIQAFTAEVFRESDLRLGPSGTGDRTKTRYSIST